MLPLPVVDDSDQSISISEEDLDVDYSENCAVSLGSSSENKGRSVRVLSQIETLEQANHALDGATISGSSSEKRQPGLCHEDEIEFPVFNNKDDPIHSPRKQPVLHTADGIIRFNGLVSTSDSDEDIGCQEDKASPILRHPKRDRGGDAWSEANQEVEALAQCERTGFSLTSGSCSKLKAAFKGGQDKVKPKFSFRHVSCEGGNFPAETSTKSGQYPADVLKSKASSQGNSRAELLEDLIGTKAEQPEENERSYQMDICDEHGEHSMAELLDSLQGRSSLLCGNSETHRRRRRRKLALKGTNILADDTDMDEDLLMDVWSSSSEEEDNSLNRQSVFQRTMVDHFEVVFDAVSSKYHMPNAMFVRQSGNALFERLQSVLLIQKEADMDFLKKSERDSNSMEGMGCLNVQILSRSLEAKLTVCRCSLLGGEGKFQMQKPNEEKILTVIFSSRACDGVELEVGNLVRVHPPWKEVNIRREDEAVILSTYFFQI